MIQKVILRYIPQKYNWTTKSECACLHHFLLFPLVFPEAYHFVSIDRCPTRLDIKGALLAKSQLLAYSHKPVTNSRATSLLGNEKRDFGVKAKQLT